jgi:hypothetical protein
MVDILLPCGGCVLAWVEAYFDESIAHKGDPILCVAGYLMVDRDAKRLGDEWSRALGKRGLPYFRMSACAHGSDPFDKLSRDDRIAVETSMIECIKRRTIIGIAVTVNVAEFERLMPRHPLIGTPYTFCAQVAIAGVQYWANERKYEDDVAYFFEAGHRSQAEADSLMRKVFNQPELIRPARYKSHAFGSSKKSMRLRYKRPICLRGNGIPICVIDRRIGRVAKTAKRYSGIPTNLSMLGQTRFWS